VIKVKTKLKRNEPDKIKKKASEYLVLMLSFVIITKFVEINNKLNYNINKVNNMKKNGML
jgi:hypothetical protein